MCGQTRSSFWWGHTCCGVYELFYLASGIATYSLYILLVRTTTAVYCPSDYWYYLLRPGQVKARPLLVASGSITGRRKRTHKKRIRVRTTSNTAAAVVRGCPCFIITFSPNIAMQPYPTSALARALCIIICTTYFMSSCCDTYTWRRARTTALTRSRGHTRVFAKGRKVQVYIGGPSRNAKSAIFSGSESDRRETADILLLHAVVPV